MSVSQLSVHQGRVANTSKQAQVRLFGALLLSYVLAVMVYIVMPGGSVDMMATYGGGATTSFSPWQLALANGGLVLVLYGAIGLLGLWLALHVELPGIYRPHAGWGRWLGLPTLMGLVCGVLIVGLDLAARWAGTASIPHPPFPASIVASYTAGVGEEILMRLFVLSLWLVILRWLFARLAPRRDTRSAAFWVANLLAALAFAASHLGTLLAITGAASPADIPAVTLAETLAMNLLIGLVAGRAFARDGLVAAAGIHFWADVVWHVIYGVLG